MKNTNVFLAEEYTDIFSEESSTQLIIRPFHIICTAMLLVGWAWLGTVIIG